VFDAVEAPDEELHEESNLGDEEAPVLELVPGSSTPEEPPQPPPPTVHILVERDEAGGATVDVVATGDIRVTEVESILKLALKRWETKAGLG
jgi:hypothetical protein